MEVALNTSARAQHAGILIFQGKKGEMVTNAKRAKW